MLPTMTCAHHKAVFAPMDHIQALAQVNITEGSVTIVAGTAEHHIFSIDPARKEHAIAVIWQQSIF